MIHYVHHHPIVISFNKLILQKDFCEFSPMASWFVVVHVLISTKANTPNEL